MLSQKVSCGSQLPYALGIQGENGRMGDDVAIMLAAVVLLSC